MTEEELHRVEQALNVKLPADYRNVMLDYPTGIDDSNSPNYALGDCLLFNDANTILEYNLSNREIDVWPRDYFVFGFDGGEHTYCIDVSRPISPVLMFNNENHQEPWFTEVAPDFAVWFRSGMQEEIESCEDGELLRLPFVTADSIQRMRNWRQARIDESKRKKEEARKVSHWWQFWK